METMSDDPYRPLTVPVVDIEEQKRKQMARDEWTAKTPLERARIIYENCCIAGQQRDPELRRQQTEQFNKVQAEYFRLLAESRR